MTGIGRVEGKVALITGAARGQGRSHAVRLAEEGADIIAIDVCGPVDHVSYPLAETGDLDVTINLVKETGRDVLARRVDVRDLAAMQGVVSEGVAQFGKIDIVCANAGIGTFGPMWEVTEEEWQTTIDINLTGVWKTIRATVPQIISQGSGGCIILTSSVGGLVGYANAGSYCAAKHGVVGLMRTLAVELAPLRIRVNTINPGTVASPMVLNDTMYELFSGGQKGATLEDVAGTFAAMNALPIAMLECIDVSNAIVYLASDDARYVTGTTFVVDGGMALPYKLPQA